MSCNNSYSSADTVVALLQVMVLLNAKLVIEQTPNKDESRQNHHTL